MKNPPITPKLFIGLRGNSRGALRKMFELILNPRLSSLSVSEGSCVEKKCKMQSAKCKIAAQTRRGNGATKKCKMQNAKCKNAAQLRTKVHLTEAPSAEGAGELASLREFPLERKEISC